MPFRTQVGRYILDGLFMVLIGTCGWVGNKAMGVVEKHEVRIQAIELSNVRIETKLDYVIKSVDEIKGELKSRKP